MTSLGPRQLLFVACVAALVRIGWAVQLGADEGPVGVMSRHLLGDERAYDSQARDFAAGGPQRERAFYQEPLYPWVLGRVYALAPPPPVSGDPNVIPMAGVHRAVIVAQHGLGVLLCVLVAMLGARCLGRAEGLGAGLLAAVSGPLVFHEAMLLKASAGLVVFTLVLLLWHRLLGQTRPRLSDAGVLGVVLGLGVLLRGNVYLLGGLVGASLLLRRRPAVSAAVALAFGALAAVLPATLHNIERGDRVLTTYQAGTNLALGQPDVDDPRRGVYYEPLRAARGDARYEEADAIALAEAGAGRPLASHEVSAWWTGEWWRRVTDRPGVAVQRTAWKLAHLFHGKEPGDVKDWPFFRGKVFWLASALCDFRFIGPLALLGLLLLPWRGASSWVLRGGVLSVALTLGLFYVMGRYRLTAAPCLWILAAGGVALIARRLTTPGATGRKVALVVVTVAALLAGRLPLLPDPLTGEMDVEHSAWVNYATIEIQSARDAPAAEAAGHRDRAVTAARRAVGQAPLFIAAWKTLIAALDLSLANLPPRSEEAGIEAWRLLVVTESLRTGAELADPQSAPPEALYRRWRELRALPSRPGTEAFVGPALAFACARIAQDLRSEDDGELAVELLDRSLAFDPDEPLAFVQRGGFLRRLGRLEDAEASFRQALDAGVDSVELHNNFGNLLLQAGRPAEALAAFTRASALATDNPVVLRNLERARQALGR